MDPKSYTTLELKAVLERLAAHTAFSASKSAALELRPAQDLEQIQERQAATREARFLLSINENLTVGGARDIREWVEAAQREAVLEPLQLLDVKSK